MYAATSVKRQKVAKGVEATRPMEDLETFHGVGRIDYKPDATYSCDEPINYHYFNANEKLQGRTMEEWLRPSVTYDLHMSQFTQPAPSLGKESSNNQSMDGTKKNIRAMFELCLKMGVKFWSGYEDDLVPDGDNFQDSQMNYEQITELLNEYQQKTGIRPLWIGVNFRNNRYANGAMTNPDANVMAHAGYQTKRAIDMANKLNSECFLINGHRENYDNSLNTDLHQDFKHYARFLKLMIEHRDKIGFRGQLLFGCEDNLRVTNVNFNYYTDNAFNVMLMLKHLNNERYFKVNVRSGHCFNMANAFGCLGCIEVTRAEDIKDMANITQSMRTIVEKGGLGPCGITFNMPLYKNHVEPKEIIESYVNTLDIFSKALRLAVKLVNDASISKQLQTRYKSYQTGWGMKFMTLDASLQECEEVVKRLQEANTPCTSNKSNHWYVVLHRYIDAQNFK